MKVESYSELKSEFEIGIRLKSEFSRNIESQKLFLKINHRDSVTPIANDNDSQNHMVSTFHFVNGLPGAQLHGACSLVDFVFYGTRGVLPATHCLLLPIEDNPFGV